MYGLSAGSRVEAASFRELLAEGDFETFLDLDFSGATLTPEEIAEADEAVALFGTPRKKAA